MMSMKKGGYFIYLAVIQKDHLKTTKIINFVVTIINLLDNHFTAFCLTFLKTPDQKNYAKPIYAK